MLLSGTPRSRLASRGVRRRQVVSTLISLLSSWVSPVFLRVAAVLTSNGEFVWYLVYSGFCVFCRVCSCRQRLAALVVTPQGRKSVQGLFGVVCCRLWARLSQFRWGFPGRSRGAMVVFWGNLGCCWSVFANRMGLSEGARFRDLHKHGSDTIGDRQSLVVCQL